MSEVDEFDVSDMTGIKVRAGWRPWRGDHAVPREDSLAAVITHFEINGYWVWSDYARLHSDGPFLMIDVMKEMPPDEGSPERHRQFAEMHASFEEGAWIEQDDTWVSYHVADLEMRMLAPDEPALAALNS